MGGKAQGLKLIAENNFLLPLTYVISEEQFLHPDFTYALNEFLTKNPKSLWAVRSSANLEDGASHSFAGLFSSHLKLNGANEIYLALEKIFASPCAPKVRDYCKRTQIDPLNLRLNAILQEYVEGDYSGVFFSFHPIKLEEQVGFLEVVEGPCEPLVSGMATPNSIEVDRGGNILGPIPPYISRNAIEDFAKQAFALQAIFGFPLDIEFTIRKNQVYFLQARPITQIRWPMSKGQWTTADLRDGGISSSIPCALMVSGYQKVLDQSMRTYMNALGLRLPNATWAKIIFGRLYWNLSAAKALMAELPGYSEEAFHQDLGISSESASSQLTAISFKSLLRGIPTLLRLKIIFFLHPLRVKKARAKIQSMREYFAKDSLTFYSEFNLLALVKRFYCRDYITLEATYFRTVYLSSAAKQDFTRAYKKLSHKYPFLSPSKLLSNLGQLHLTNTTGALLSLAEKIKQEPKAISLLQSGESENLWNMLHNCSPELADSMNSFLDLYGHHSDSEMDIRVPRWREDPSTLIKQLQKCLHMENSKVSAASYQDELAGLKLAIYKHEGILGLTFNYLPFLVTLKRVRRYLVLREEMRDSSTRMYEWIRDSAREIYSRIEKKTGPLNASVFDLSQDQLLGFCKSALDPSLNVKNLISEIEATSIAHKNYGLGYSRMPPLHDLGIEERKNFSVPSTNYFTGLASSIGKYQGRARVIRSLDESHLLQAGEVLVAPFTDPGWTPLFLTCKAIVLESGGLLSHAALISREYGIPSVLNVAGATSKIKTGDLLLVDGDSGTVSLIAN